ncbi:autotransporter-associated beta strand repeat-containing protein [Rhodobacteraceae bacterium XHP0102]|nr:autotransporter-associated beta strand repeat-containing protein [Rhodobacteraceae bacterium XHP0102]
MTQNTSAAQAAQGANATQTGIRQRSLRKHCRLGHATELVFITALGTAVMIGGGADAQTVNYTDGQDRTAGFVADPINTFVFVDGTDNATQSGVISGDGNLIKQGTGSLTFSAANTYTGTTTVNAGTLRITNNSALGTTAGGTVVASGATLEIDGNTNPVGETLTLNGTGVGGGGALRFTGADGLLSTNIILGSDTLIVNDAASLVISLSAPTNYTITGANHDLTFGGNGRTNVFSVINLGTGSLIKNGSGELVLRGEASFTGGLIIKEGSVFASANILSDTVLVQISSGASWTTNATGTIGNLSGAGDVTLGRGAILTLGDATDRIFSGVLSNTGGITKQGSGTLTLSGANTYAGATTVSAGTLRITNSSALGTTAGGTVVASGATLEIDGATNPIGETLTLNGTGVGGGGALRFTGAGGSLSTNIILGSDTLIVNTTGNRTFANNAPTTHTITGNHNLTFGGNGAITVNSNIEIGTGGIIKTGSGQLTLFGTNTFTGDVQINQGRLLIFNGNAIADSVLVQVASGGTFEVQDNETVGNVSGAGRIDLNPLGAGKTLTVGDASDSEFSGIITGSNSSITKQGSGTLTLSGANTYGGTTTVSAGTLRITNSGALGTTAGGTVVASGATLEIDGNTNPAGETLTLNGTGVGGGGALRFTGAGVRLSTNIILGSDTLIVNAAGENRSFDPVFTAGAPPFTIRGTNHNLTFGGNGPITVRSDIDLGTGSLIKNGSGRLQLTPTGVGAVNVMGSLIINEGTVQTAASNLSDTVLVQISSGATWNAGSGTIGNLSGAGDVSLIGTVTLGDATDRTFSGVISGARDIPEEAITKQGSGTLTLSGANTYAGATTVNAGRLNVTGSITSAATINAGGTLGGTGTVGAVTAQSGGTLAAGNSIGTLNTGDVTLNAGSVLEVEVDPNDATRADLINATGNVTINGATLRHVGEAGTYAPDRTWRIITATGTVTGTFGAVASDYTFLTPTAIYGANFVNLRLLRNDVSFESVARTRNQRNTARGIGTIAGSDAANALLPLSGDAARNALDQFSGAGLAAIGAGQLGEGQSIVTTLTGQMGGAGGDGGGGGGGEGGGGSIVTASSRGGQGTPSGLWANLYGDGSSRSLDGITTDLRNAGLILGHDLRFGAWDGGVFIGRGQSQSDTAALGTRATTQSLSLGTYANRRFGEMDLSLGLIGTWGDVQSTRTVAVGALNQTLSANYSTRMLTGFAEMARRYEGAVWSATPFARLTQQWLHNDGFTETGGTAALTRGAETTTQTLLTLGAELERPLGAGRFSANAALTQSFGGAAEATYRLGNSTPFTVEGDAPRDTSLDLGLGYEIPLSNTATLTLAANATRQGNATTRRFGLNFGLRF